MNLHSSTTRTHQWMTFPSEARRSNSFIKTQKQFGETLQHLISEERGRCEFFPKTVRELLALNGQSNISRFSPPQSYSPANITDAKVVELVEFFGKVNPDPKAKVQNLNWFLTKIGVTYQYVYRRPFRPFPP